ncbi:MAG: hypothetical protein K2I47_01815 [Odoribacter sp.]|nr:hypothetical protein [Odoribacter sp.]
MIVTNIITLYACVGSMYGYNGGGTGEAIAGGASDIRRNKGDGNWNHFEGLKSRIMVSAGGGGGTYYATAVYQIGHAGGLQGYSANICTERRYCGYSGTGATQTTGGAPGKTSGHAGTMGASAWGSFGQGGSFKGTSSGGGGGYYGGGHGVHPGGSYPGGGGGSSFISGHNGCNAVSASSTSGNIIHTGQSVHYSGLSFTNTIMIDGAGYQWTTIKGSYVGMPNLAGTGTMTGNTSHGQVKITPLN